MNLTILEIAKILENLRLKREEQEKKRHHREAQKIRDEEDWYRDLAFELDY